MVTYLGITYNLGDVYAKGWSFRYVPREIRIVDDFEVECFSFVIGLSVEFPILNVGFKVEECCPVIFFADRQTDRRTDKVNPDNRLDADKIWYDIYANIQLIMNMIIM